jgi:choline dehydrogenase-like flavoprotein
LPVTPAADVVVCGAGIAGVAAAYHLAARHGVRRVVLVDERPPLSLTSDKSTEAYRNFWPGPDDAMVRFMNRSIDLLEELAGASDNVFRMNRRGYVFGTAEPARAAELRAMAKVVADWGAGPLRIHDGRPEAAAYPPPSAGDWHAQPAGIDLLTWPGTRWRFSTRAAVAGSPASSSGCISSSWPAGPAPSWWRDGSRPSTSREGGSRGSGSIRPRGAGPWPRSA